MKKPIKLNTQFLVMIIVFIVTATAATSYLTYHEQVKQTRSLCKDRLMSVGSYLAELILKDPQVFVSYKNYYEEHYEDIRIPVDFDNYEEAREKFFHEFKKTYPDKMFGTEVPIDDLTDELKNLYFTYYQEYWLLTFEKARESFNLPYTYFLLPNDETKMTVYMIDGERTEDPAHPGYLYMGDSYYEEVEDHPLMWNTWKNGVRYDDVYEWNNEWGNTYSYYTPLVIDGKTIGLIVTEMGVGDVDDMIKNSTMAIAARLAIALGVLGVLTLWFINLNYLRRINHLSDQIRDFSASRAYDTADAIKSYPYGNDEIYLLAENTADMINDLKNSEDKIKRAAQYKSDFLANMSHEIRTPMNAIVGLSDLLKSESITDRAREYAEQIGSSSNALLVVIDDILDFSRIEDGYMQILPVDYDPRKLLEETVDTYSMGLSGKPVKMGLKIDPDMPASLRGDSARIRQILNNLLSNAVKFTNEGSISIDAGCEKTDDEKMMLKLSVADTGVGIKDEDVDRIFESFSQADGSRARKAEGVGIGLTISQRLSRLMGGNIEVESEYGKGSTFRVMIPQELVKAEDTEAVTASEAAGEHLHLPDAKLLVVDDNSVNLYIARNLLGLYGIKPICVKSGNEAIKAAAKYDFDLVLMDYMMPEMDGIEATKRIREEYPAYRDIPIIAFTANAVEEARELLLKSGMDDFISKPVKASDLEDMLRKWLCRAS